MLSTPPAFILSQDQTLCKNARNFVAAVTLRCIFTEKPPATDAHSASRWRPAAPASEKTICHPVHSSRFDRSRYPLGYLFLFYCFKGQFLDIKLLRIFKVVSLFSYQCTFCCCLYLPDATFISYHIYQCLSTTFFTFYFVIFSSFKLFRDSLYRISLV